MIRLYECLRHEHDWRLVLLAALICLASSVLAAMSLERIKTNRGRSQAVWICTTSVIVGSGIWATHFVAMLAYQPSVGFSFDLQQTIVSLIVMIAIAVPGLYLIGNHQTRSGHWIGGAIVGAGISAMHYTGMYGLLPHGFMEWDLLYLGVSVALGIVLSIAAFDIHGRISSLKGQFLCAGMFTLAICATHFFGMSALTLIPLSDEASAGPGLSPMILGGLIGSVVFLLIQAGLVAAVFDNYRMRRRRTDAHNDLKMRTLLSSVGEVARIGGWSLDVKDNNLRWTSQLFDLHDLAPGETMTLDMAADFFIADARETFLSSVRSAMETGESFDLELPLKTSTNNRIWVRVIGKTLVDDGRPGMIIGAYQDVSESKRQRARLQAALMEADRQNRFKSEFLARMSHELRTPLNGVLGMGQLLGSTALDPRQTRCTETIMASGEALLFLVDDILNVSELEAGLVEIKTEPFNLKDRLDSVLDPYRVQASASGLTLDWECRGLNGSEFLGDPDRIEQVLQNLISNALKFTEKGLVRVIVAMDNDGQDLRFNVVDTGPGIEEKWQQNIFDRFTMVDGSSTRSHGGSGLGLAISRDLVGLMGGRIGVSSRVGIGSNFWFTIPLNRASSGANDSRPDSTEAPHLPPLTAIAS